MKDRKRRACHGQGIRVNRVRYSGPMRCPSCDEEMPAGARVCPTCSGSDTWSSSERSPRPASGSGGRAPADRFAAGTLLAGRYRIVRLLGRGAMGMVYHAEDLTLEVPVALKFLTFSREGDPERRELFLNEVRLARRITHPNVCRVYDVGEVGGRHFISMEYIDGEDLASLVKRVGRLSTDRALRIGLEIARGLEAAHAEGILHRDLKPANLMIDGDGHAHVADFGLASRPGSESGSGVIAGTPDYMAPEQIGGAVSVYSDLYALGLVLYELFTGRKAYERPAVFRRGRPEPPPPLGIDGLDLGVERAILACLESDPHDRPGSAAEVAAALARGAAPPWHPAPGVAIAHRPNWVLDQRLGEGGFGEAWLAAHRKTGEQRVFKFCRDAAKLRTLQREITLFRLLKEELGRRDDIVSLLDWSLDEPPYFIEAEYTAGGNLREWAARHGGLAAVPLATRLEVVAQAATALAAAHSVGVMHKDVKPANVLVDEDAAGRPRALLADFGIGALTERKRLEAAGITVAGLTETDSETSSGAGTRLYMAPEIVEGKPATLPADVYALGVLLYLLLTGRRPLSFAAYTAPEIARVVCDQEPPRPSAVVAGRHGRALAGDLDTVVLKALAKSPERRYGSADQLSEDLRRHLEGLPVLARKDTFVYRAGKFVRRHRWGMAAAALVFLSLVAGMAAAAWQARVARAERATAEWVSGFLVDLFEITHPGAAQGETVTAVQLLDQGARRIAGEPPERPEVQAALMDNIGRAYFKLGLYERAEPLLADALERRRAALGPDHPEVAASLHHVGELRAAQGRYEEAERMHRRELELRLAELGEGRQLVAESRNSLALALYPQSRFDEAEELLRRSLALQERALGGEHPEVATTLNNLALVLRSASRFEEAEALYRQALPILRGRLGEGAPELAACLNNLAQVLRVRGECEEAIGLWEDALTIERRILDERHPELAVLQNNLAGCLRDVGRDGEAERLYRASLELRRETLGPAHPDVADSLNNLARIHFDRGDLDAAESLYREALAVNRGRDGGKHLDVATNLSNLASVLARKADPAAEPLYREALALRLDLLGPEHAAVATDRHNLAGLLFRSGAFDEAEELYREALRVRRRTLGDGHRLTADTLFGLGWLLADRGPPERAEAPLREGLDLWRQWPEKEWVKVASTQSLLGGCLTALGRYAEAEPLLLESLAAFRGRLGDGDSRTVRTLRRAVELYEVWERPDEAARYRALL